MYFEEIKDMKEYDDFVTNHPLCNLLQSSKWPRIKENWDHIYYGVRDEQDKLIATAAILIKRLPLNFTMFYIPRGPIMQYEDISVVSFMMKSLKDLGKKYRCLYIKMDPGIIKHQCSIKDYKNTISPEAKQQMDTVLQCGGIHLGYSLSLNHTVQPRFHATVMKSDDFYDTLPKHTKRHIATARKKFVTVEICGSECTNDFVKLTQATEERKNIKLRDAHYFQLLLDTYGENAHLFLAYIDLAALLCDSEERLKKLDKQIEKFKEKDEKKASEALDKRSLLEQEINMLRSCQAEQGSKVPVAGALVVKYGKTCEMLYMGMDGKYRKYMAPYLSHFVPMEWAFDNGCTMCNMGGVEGTLDDGLTKFKSNFNPDIIEYVGEFDIPVYKSLYRIAQCAYKLRKLKNRH